MEYLAVLVIAVLVIILILIKLAELIEFLAVLIAPFWFGLLGIGSLAVAIFVFIYFKPHQAEKHFESYKKGEITKKQAVEKIVDTMYKPGIDKIPPVYQSKIIEKRINALRKRIKTETSFIEDLIKYIKTRSKIE